MKYPESGNKIKEQRLQIGVSQEELAEVSRLSLRTIQRIENGETAPRGDSLKRIAKALGVDVQDLVTALPAAVPAPGLREDKWILFLINFSALGFLIYPFAGIIFPMVVWIVYKDKVLLADETGRKTMKFQIWWCLLLLVACLYIFSFKLFHVKLPAFENHRMMLFIPFSLYVLNILVTGFNILLNFRKRSFDTLSLQAAFSTTQNNKF